MRKVCVELPFGVAIHEDTIAIGGRYGAITLVSYATFEPFRVFKDLEGTAPGKIANAISLCFTPDGKNLIIGEHIVPRMSVFTLEGVFVRCVGERQLSEGNKDTAIAAGGEIIVADWGTNRVCVFSPDGSTLLRCWGRELSSSPDAQFLKPVALAVWGPFLYVMEDDSPRVQVFC